MSDGKSKSAITPRVPKGLYLYVSGPWSTYSCHRDPKTGEWIERCDSGVIDPPRLIASGDAEE